MKRSKEGKRLEKAGFLPPVAQGRPKVKLGKPDYTPVEVPTTYPEVRKEPKP